MIAMHHFSFADVVGLLVEVHQAYFKLNTTKSVDDLTQHFLMLSLCFNPKLLSSWYTIVYDYRKGQVFPFRIGPRREFWKLLCHLKPLSLDQTKVKVELMKGWIQSEFFFNTASSYWGQLKARGYQLTYWSPLKRSHLIRIT